MAVIEDSTQIKFLPHPIGTKFKDITNQRFSSLVAIGFVGYDKHKKTIWLCRCDCGVLIKTTKNRLHKGCKTSCGCVKYVAPKRTDYSHLIKTKVYRAWVAMKNRCFNPKFKNFKDYQGRGITVAPEWIDNFQAFYEHIGEPPTRYHSVDRYPNNDGNYEPGNVRWATQTEQCRNTRRNKLITFNGITLSVTEWAEKIGIGERIIWRRIYQRKWCIECSLTKPIAKKGSNLRIHSCTH